MKALKIIGIVAVVLTVIILGLALFLPGKVTFRRIVDVDARPHSVFELVNDLKNWEQWSAFHEDTTIKVDYEGPQSGTGAISRWVGDQAGRGKQTITKSISPEVIETEIDFYERGKANAVFQFEETEKGTRVTWIYHMDDLNYPLDRYFGLMAEGMLAPFFEKSLDKLKTLAETQKEKLNWKTSSIVIEKIEPQHALIISQDIDIDSIGPFLGRSYQAILNYMNEKDYERAGPPFAVYPEWRPESKTGVIAGIPVSDNAQGTNGIEKYELPGGQAAIAIHYGSYAQSGKTHMAINRFISKENLERNGEPWESYLNDPSEINDTLKWETRIVYPVKSGTKE